MEWQPLWVELAVAGLAVIVAASLAWAAERSARSLLAVAAGHAALGLAMAGLFGGVSIYADFCPVCGHGWDIDVRFFLAAVAAAAGLAFALVVRRGWPGFRVAVIASCVVYAGFRLGLGLWVS